MRETKSHLPYNRFKGFLREKGLTYQDIANLIQATAPTVSQKINGKSDFFWSEIQIISKEYGINYDIFL